MRMTVVTKSYAPDFELCSDLNRSVLDYAPASVHHQIIVPQRDLSLFRQLDGPRTHIRCETEFLPRSFVATPFGNFTINLRRPLPPVRGWILQQIVKLAAVAASDDDVVLVADSDVEFIRPFDADTFVRNGSVHFFRMPDYITARLPRHVIWHRIGRELLGLPLADLPHPDYIWGMVACDPSIVRQMLARIEATTGRPWASAIARQLHFSEWTVYGLFVDEVIGAPANASASDDPLCLAYWETVPLNRHSAAGFFEGARPTDVAAMISAKSHTPLAIRRAAFADHRAAQDRLNAIEPRYRRSAQ